MNYFEVLELSIEALEGQNETDIEKSVREAHTECYSKTIGSYANIPREGGRSNTEWQAVLNQARDTLIDPEKRRAHIEDLREPVSTPGSTPASAPPRAIAKFSNGDEATSIAELAVLMMKHFEFAKDALYRGSLATSLDGAGELHFAEVARTIVQECPDQNVGLKALVQILEEKIQFQGGKAGTPQQLASLIDREWEYGKDLLYNGFMAFFFEHVNQKELADIADRITHRYAGEEDMGLEFLVQRLDPHIGLPDPQANHTRINFGKVDTETRKTIRLEIENAGRGFLYGDVVLARKMPGIRVSSTPIRGRAVVMVELDASPLAAKQTHETELIIKTNGGELTIPISCYVDYPIEKSIRRVVISSLLMGAIALVVRWIVLEYGSFRFSWLTSAKFVDLDDFGKKWFEWPMWEVVVHTPDFAGIGFVIGFAALGTGLFYFFWKRRFSFWKRRFSFWKRRFSFWKRRPG